MPMTLSAMEKKLIRRVLERHLEEVRKNEQLLNQEIALLGAEVQYEEFVEGIIKKLR